MQTTTQSLTTISEPTVSPPQSTDLYVDGVCLTATVDIPRRAAGIVIIADASGMAPSLRDSYQIAAMFRERKLGSMVLSLVTPNEALTAVRIADVDALAKRLNAATRWIEQNIPGLPIGYLGASTAGTAALFAASEPINEISAVVVKNSPTTLAGVGIGNVVSPTLLLVGRGESQLSQDNERAQKTMHCESHIEYITNDLRDLVDTTAYWFVTHMRPDLHDYSHVA